MEEEIQKVAKNLYNQRQLYSQLKRQYEEQYEEAEKLKELVRIKEEELSNIERNLIVFSRERRTWVEDRERLESALEAAQQRPIPVSEIEEWIKKKIEEKDINYFEYSEFSKFIEIGKGGFGIITKAETNDKKQVALKSLANPAIDKNDFVKELQFLRMVSYHDNINKFLGITKDNVGYVMVLEYANEGNLRDYLKKEFDSLQWENKIQMAVDITRGLRCLHSKDIVHRDLHSKNVLVNNGKLLIADFGLSKQLTEVTSNSMSNRMSMYNRMGIIEYIEPQCIRNVKYTKDKRSDVYSLGVLLWEITSGRPPFHNIEERNMLGYHISHENFREEPIEGTPLEYQELYQKCWDGDPEKRPDVNQVYNEILRQSKVNDTQEENEDSSNSNGRDDLNIHSGQDLYISDIVADSQNLSL